MTIEKSPNEEIAVHTIDHIIMALIIVPFMMNLMKNLIAIFLIIRTMANKSLIVTKKDKKNDANWIKANRESKDIKNMRCLCDSSIAIS